MFVLSLAMLLASIAHADEPKATPSTAPQLASPPQAPPAAGSMEEVMSLRDPFKRPEPEIGKGPPRTELEYFNLDEFRMVAVLTGPTKLRAMLQISDGRSFIVQSGQKIGKRNGVILRIGEDAVLVRERIFNVLGKEENVDTEIPLQPDPRARLVIQEKK